MYTICITCRFGEYVAELRNKAGEYVTVLGRGRTAEQARKAIASSFRHLPVEVVDAAAEHSAPVTEEPTKAA